MMILLGKGRCSWQHVNSDHGDDDNDDDDMMTISFTPSYCE